MKRRQPPASNETPFELRESARRRAIALAVSIPPMPASERENRRAVVPLMAKRSPE